MLKVRFVCKALQNEGHLCMFAEQIRSESGCPTQTYTRVSSLASPRTASDPSISADTPASRHSLP